MRQRTLNQSYKTATIIFLLSIIPFPLSIVYGKIPQYSAKQIILFGQSTAQVGRAGTGVASSQADLFLLNPASIGQTDRMSFSLNYSTIPVTNTHYIPSFSLAIPTSYGVIGSSLYYFNIPRSTDFTSGYGASIGISKAATDNLLLGCNINVLLGGFNSKSFSIGTTLGLQYLFKSTSIKNGFGLINPRLGLSISIGYPFYQKNNAYDLNQATIGYTFTFYTSKYFKAHFYNDFTAVNYREFPVKIGLEFEIINIIFLRGGYSYPYAYNKNDYSVGVGLKYFNERFAGSIQYALAHQQRGGFMHYIGCTIEVGSIDNRPPVIAIGIDNKYISPNHDGIKDFALFSISIEDDNVIGGWKIQITDATGQIVKEYSLTQNDLSHNTGIRKIVHRLFTKRENLIIPDKIIWDGTDSNGKRLPDGKYSYSFIAWDIKDNISASKTGSIIIDAVTPEIILKKSDEIFSPNGDGKKDTYQIQQTIKSSNEDTCTASFKNADGKTIKSYSWDGDKVPPLLNWDGISDDGTPAPDGIYTYQIQCADKAGNSAFSEIRDITLTRQIDNADIVVSTKFFSYNTSQSIKLFPRLSRTNGLTSWQILVYNGAQKIVHEFSGQSELPKVIEWNGTDSLQKHLSDGKYSIQLKALFSSGNMPESFSKEIIFDSTPPAVSISHLPSLFSPDHNGDNDILIIKPSIHELYGVREWTITITSSFGDVFKRYNGKGSIPGEILWDGHGDNGELVESATDYSMVLEISDNAGNYAKSKIDIIHVDVLVLVTERGLKIRISNIEFPIDSEEIKDKSKTILQRVVDVLKKYSQYDINIEGHTDDIGKEEYNLELSERRAHSVYKFLVDHGIQKSRLQFIGMGESVPLYPNTNDENRRRNRRVEFILIKKGN